MTRRRMYLTRRNSHYLLLSHMRPRIVSEPEPDAVPDPDDRLYDQHICHGWLRVFGLNPEEFEMLEPATVWITVEAR